MINLSDLVIFVFAVAIVVAFFVLLRRALRKADLLEDSEDHDPTES
jgi:hypothetical protein